jgi:hypothetical protein
VKIENKDITFVIQGKIDYDGEVNITKKLVDSIVKFFPRTKIIVSTWSFHSAINQCVDQFIVNDDPGIIDTNNKYLVNYNRMVVSTSNGLRNVKTKYAVKVRSDFWFESKSDFIKIYEDKENKLKYKHIGVNQHIMMCMGVNPLPIMPYLISDLWQFGLCDDLILLWEEAEFDPERLGNYSRTKHWYKKLYQLSASPSDMNAPFNSEQLLCENIAKKLNIIFPLDYRKNSSFFNLVKSYKSMSGIFTTIPRQYLNMSSKKHESKTNENRLLDSQLWDLANKANQNKSKSFLFHALLALRMLMFLKGLVTRKLLSKLKQEKYD